MTAARRTGLLITGVVGLAVMAGVATVLVMSTGAGGKAKPGTTSTAFTATTPLPELFQAIRDSDARALAAVVQRSAAEVTPAIKPLTETEAEQWVEVVKAMRTGFTRFGSNGRAMALTVVGRVLQRFAVETAPATWVKAIQPSHDVVAAGLADPNLDVRVAALIEVGKLWNWMPGKTPMLTEESLLVSWKEGFERPVLDRLGDREPKARAAAVACLGYLHVNPVAAHAIPYLDDLRSPEVRQQVLISFANRPSLLTDDTLLRQMFDKDPRIPDTAQLILKTRGLNQEQISLGSMIFHPKAEIRASVIPLLKNRSDVDPVVWLLQLSRDAEESVRLGAIEALSARMSPEVGQRLVEMAETDKSPAVRRDAAKYLPTIQKTAALPPLPGSPSLNPKAN